MNHNSVMRPQFLSSLVKNSHTDIKINSIRFALILMNYSIVLFTTIVIAHTTNIVCIDYKAYQLLSNLTSVPIPPVSLIVLSQISFFLILGLIVIRIKFKNLSESLNLLLISVDIFLALLVLYYLNISNKGILLLVITNIMVYVQNKRYKYIFLTLCILLYIFIDFDILSAQLNLYSFGDYLNYYNAATRILLFGIRNILYSLTLVLFILFMTFEIQIYREESTRVKELNKALLESTNRLRLSNIQLQEYSKRNEEMAKLKERNRLAREIHDTIGHYLTAIDMGIKSCLKAKDNDPHLLSSQLEKVNELTRKSLIDVRRSIKELRPDALTRYSLHSAISNLANEISEFSRAKVQFLITGNEYKLNTQIEEFVYRISQEGISNAIRHSSPTKIDLFLTYQEDGLKIRIVNNGLKDETIDPGFGLSHIKAKVEEFSGSFNYSVNSELEFILQIFIPQARRTS